MENPLISKRNSLLLRGGGIILMLIHHLFYSPESRALYDDVIVQGIGLVNQIGIFSKLCVAIFIFVSGYGLTVSTPQNISPKDFYWRRYKKLYFNYWYIWLLFVPISIFVFGRTFEEAYGNHIMLKAILDFIGLLKIFEIDSYNPTWWFYSCIIILYLLFPILNKYLWNSTYLILSIAVAIGLFSFIPGVKVIYGYLLVFITGMLITKMPVKWIDNCNIMSIICALLIFSLWRMTRTCPTHISDSFICVGLAFLLYKVTLWKWLVGILEELGKHSMNMFLTHTFIFYFWFKDFIYITRNPLLIFLSLLITTYLLSIFIEWTKRKIGFYNI